MKPVQQYSLAYLLASFLKNTSLSSHVYLSGILMLLMVIVSIEAFRKWYELLRVRTPVADEYGRCIFSGVLPVLSCSHCRNFVKEIAGHTDMYL